jgi:hypothetical protein
MVLANAIENGEMRKFPVLQIAATENNSNVLVLVFNKGTYTEITCRLI